MTRSEFCWWLHGWMEIEKPEIITEKQVKEIKNHLNLVINGEVDPFKYYLPTTLGSC